MFFSEIERIDLPEKTYAGEGFSVTLTANGEIPFAQLIVRHDDGWEWIVKGDLVERISENQLVFHVPAEAFHEGLAYMQAEGCRNPDFMNAGPDDWVKSYAEVYVDPARQDQPQPENVSTPAPEEKKQEEPAAPQPEPAPRTSDVNSREPVIYFGIHKHMHQPYYRSVDTGYWDGDIDGIFSSRGGAYSHFVPMAVRQYIDGGLSHAGLSTSWSGTLIEQLNRAESEGLCGGCFGGWKDGLRSLAGTKTALGNPRIEFTAFGFFHPLMPLIPARDIIGQIEMHRQVILESFGGSMPDVLFPPETAFHPHMIPALNKAGIRAVIFDSIHHFRACRDYPYAGKDEGMLPPNTADQENFPAEDWMQLNNIWAPGKISPSLLKPCWLCYTDPDGVGHKIIGVPAERYLGNEDARGGYGALQYESVMGQIRDHIITTNTYDPEHPPFFILHSDGDNHGGGADSYYGANTARLVEMCKNDSRFQLISIKDYLSRFPVDPANVVHVEPGSWAGADNGDPQFAKWFSWEDKDYSPDLNSWAVLTAFQNMVHTLEDQNLGDEALHEKLRRLLYTAETSCYWYWTGQDIWDKQVTEAANTAFELVGGLPNDAKEEDSTPPTIFLPWVRPANPGGLKWGNNCLIDAEKEPIVRTFVYDVSGLTSVTLYYFEVGGSAKSIEMKNRGAYECRTGARQTSHLYEATLPEGGGNFRFMVEALDKRGNRAVSPLLRVFCQ